MTTPAVRPPARPARKPAAPKGPLGVLVRILGSYGLAVALLLFLFVLTFFGTLEQQTTSLFDVQEKFFASAFVVYRVGGVFPILLPGGYLLLSLLLVNLVVGGIIRLRKRTQVVGVLIAHIGIVLMLVGSFVERQWSTKGQMWLYEGEASSVYRSAHEWEVAILRQDPETRQVREWIIPDDHFDGLDAGEVARFTASDLPFVVHLDAYQVNSGVNQSAHGGESLLLAKPPTTNPKTRNIPALRATFVDKQDVGRRQSALLWALQRLPYAFHADGAVWGADLRPRSWVVPFEVRLRDFQMETYPGTSMAKRYSSYVTNIDGDVQRDVHITMNEPMRDRRGNFLGGYTFYQSDYGPKPEDVDRREYSVFSVVYNPSDLVPLLSCLVIAFGLLVHFVMKLVAYLRREARLA